VSGGDRGRRQSTELLELEEITSAIVKMACLDFSSPLPECGEGALGAVSAGLEALREELKSGVVPKARADAANQARADFLASMSHELRTPLSSVIGCTELLKNTELDPVQLELVWHVERASQALEGLVQTVLDYSSISSGSVALVSAAFALADSFEEIVGDYQSVAEHAGLSLQLCTAGLHVLTVEGDRGRLTQVLNSLLSNAMKFTAEGHVRVRAVSIGRGRSHRLRVEVEDTGVGIDSSMLGQVFERFVQVPGVRERGASGVGLGLCISRALVEELMGGEIGVHSVLGKGCTFWFEVPMPAAVAVAPVYELPAAKGRVLVTDDNPEVRQVTADMLTLLGYEVTVAACGAEGVELATTRGFDLILMDLRMPDISGYEAARQIRSFLVDASPPIVACTAQGSMDMRPEDACMDDRLDKPFRIQHLSELVARWIPAKE
jgi:signal transduction histidine kinase